MHHGIRNPNPDSLILISLIEGIECTIGSVVTELNDDSEKILPPEFLPGLSLETVWNGPLLEHGCDDPGDDLTELGPLDVIKKLERKERPFTIKFKNSTQNLLLEKIIKRILESDLNQP